MFGLSTMRWTVIAGSSLMTSAFMLYLTDYAGLANAAGVATVLLLFGRILDAVDDPLQGYIMDNAKKTRIGKFKPFMLGGIVLTALSLIMLFNMPENISDWLKIAYLFVGYILYEIGFSFQPDTAIKISMTDDPNIREKLLITPRVVEQFVAIPFSFFISAALAVSNLFDNNYRKGFGVTAILYVLPIAVIAFIGACLVQEGPYVTENPQRLKIKDVLMMLKNNKPLWISQLAGFIGGCVFTFVIAAVTYYIKWAYGPENFGMNSAIWGAVILLGIVLGTLFASPILKRTIPVEASIICNIGQVVPLAVIFVLHLIGGPVNRILFFGLLFVSMIFSGMSYIPGSLINMECMDYVKWQQKTGMEAIVQAIGNFITKAQTALAGLATGAVLVIINNDASLYESEAFIEAGGTIPPSLLTGLTFVFCAIPVFLGLTAALILKAYPIKGALRDQMYRELHVR